MATGAEPTSILWLGACCGRPTTDPDLMLDAPGHRLDQHRLFTTTDLDEARESVARVFCPHRLEVVRAEHVATVHNRVDLKPFSLNYITYGANVDIVPGALERFYLLQLPLGGSARVRSGHQQADADASSGTILSPSQPVAMSWTADCRKLLVQIERSAVERTAEAMLGRPLGAPLDFDLALRAGSAAHTAMRQIALLLCEDVEGGGLLSRGLAAARLGDALVTALLLGQRHSYSGALDGSVPSIAPAHVKRAERFMRERASDPIGVADIASAAGVSVRALQEGFRRFRDMSPLEGLRLMRIDLARADLLSGRAGETVTTVALKWGFTHLGRFSGAYRQRFDETPSQTLRRSGGATGLEPSLLTRSDSA